MSLLDMHAFVHQFGKYATDMRNENYFAAHKNEHTFVGAVLRRLWYWTDPKASVTLKRCFAGNCFLVGETRTDPKASVTLFRNRRCCLVGVGADADERTDAGEWAELGVWAELIESVEVAAMGNAGGSFGAGGKATCGAWRSRPDE